MNQKYQLNNGVYFVAGATRGALLDTNSGNVYSINRQACQVVQYEADDPAFWRSLVNMDLAEPAENPRVNSLPDEPLPETLRFLWFEVVTDTCNERCIHCYADSLPVALRNLPEDQEIHSLQSCRRMSHADWENAIREGYRLGCRSCQFIGGEPFLYRGENGETLFDLLQLAHETGYTYIEVFTNGTLLNQERIHLLKELGIQVAVSLYSDIPEIHDEVTRTSGSHAKTIQSLQALRESGVKTRVETVVLRANQKSVESTVAYRQQLGHRGKTPSPLWPTGRGTDRQIRPDTATLVRYGFRLIPDFEASKEKINHYLHGNPCLLGKAAITEHGEVLPCILGRNHMFGNLLETQSLQAILEGERCQRIWHTTKDSIYACKDCEYRYVCFDCRPLAEAESGEQGDFFSSPNPRCTYSPYIGDWGDGSWKVNKDGQPIYDRTYARVIRSGRRFLLKSLEKEYSE